MGWLSKESCAKKGTSWNFVVRLGPFHWIQPGTLFRAGWYYICSSRDFFFRELERGAILRGMPPPLPIQALCYHLLLTMPCFPWLSLILVQSHLFLAILVPYYGLYSLVIPVLWAVFSCYTLTEFNLDSRFGLLVWQKPRESFSYNFFQVSLLQKKMYICCLQAKTITSEILLSAGKFYMIWFLTSFFICASKLDNSRKKLFCLLRLWAPCSYQLLATYN